MKLITSLALLAGLFLGERPALGDAASMLQKLKDDPTGSPAAARWFANLSLEKKRTYAGQLGIIVLEADTGTEHENFAVAFGADRSPYPWVLIVGKHTLGLAGGNSFEYLLRDDESVKNQWGVRWDVKQSYRTRFKTGAVVFDKEPISKGTAGFDLWIPASGWRYVGPKLPKSDRVLRARAAPNGEGR